MLMDVVFDLLLLGVLLAWLLFLYTRYWLRREEEEKAQVHQLVEKIIGKSHPSQREI